MWLALLTHDALSDQMGDIGLPSVEWFPQEYAFQFFAVKGTLALLATVMLIFHMVKTWDWVANWGQRLRYFTLLYFAGLFTAASPKQMAEVERGARLVDWPNIAVLIGAVGLIFTMAVSIWLDLQRDKTHPKHL
jgi:hypothetical protein